MIKKYLKSYAYLFSILLILTLIFSLISYFTNSSSTIIKILIPVISMLISTIILGKKTTSLAYLEGIKFSTIYIILALIINYLILRNPFNYKALILYALIIFSGVIGSMIGINLKRK